MIRNLTDRQHRLFLRARRLNCKIYPDSPRLTPATETRPARNENRRTRIKGEHAWELFDEAKEAFGELNVKKYTAKFGPYTTPALSILRPNT